MKLWNTLKLLFICGDELEEIVMELRDRKFKEQQENNAYRLNLCYKHRQEANHSHFAEHNCDHCKAQKLITKLTSLEELL